MADETLRQLLLEAAEFIDETAEDFHASNVNHKGSFTDPDDGPHYRRMTELVMRLNRTVEAYDLLNALASDDAEPLTEPILDKMTGHLKAFNLAGFSTSLIWQPTVPTTIIVRQSQVAIGEVDDGEDFDSVAFPCPTRGDLRRLLAALKVPQSTPSTSEE